MKQSVQLDPLDRRILEALQADAALSQAELAERVGSLLEEHPSVGGASSHFALSTTKYTIAIPIR